MKLLLILALLCSAGYYAYWEYSGGSRQSNAGKYSLKTLETKPVPQKEFFELQTDVALKLCADPGNAFGNATPQECRRNVADRSGECARSTGRNAPAVIGDIPTAKALGRTYVRCVLPFPKCGGVEVKTEEEARRHCK